MSTEAMTISDEELVERLRKQAKQAHAMDIYLAQGEVGPGEQSKQMTKAADAITRLLREKSELANTAHLRFKEIVDLGVKVASARAQGAEEMRATVLNAIRTGLFTYKLSGQRDDEMDAALKANIQDMREQVLDRLTALPLPSPVAARAVPEGWKLVPVEPTRRMQGEGAFHVIIGDGAATEMDLKQAACVYRAMLSAAPSPPK